jgi:hypothetical protein
MATKAIQRKNRRKRDYLKKENEKRKRKRRTRKMIRKGAKAGSQF